MKALLPIRAKYVTRYCMCSRIAGLGALVLAVSLAGCNQQTETPVGSAPAEVDFTTVTQTSIRQWDEFNGRISAVDSVEVRPRVTGYVEKIAFKEGDEVRKGDPLFQIDSRKYQAALNSALARLEKAKASVVMNEAQDRRARVLVQANAISREDADTRRANFNQSQADVQDAAAAVALAKLDVEFTDVRSPINGRVSRAALTVGNLAVADQTLLTSVVSQNPVYVYFDPDEYSYLRYSQQARGAQSKTAQLGVRVGLANEQGFPHSGTVDFLDNQVDPSTGTIRLRATLSNRNHAFTPGLFARVQLSARHETDAILIDDKAVLTDQDRKYVYVVAADSTAERKDIVLGQTQDGLRIVQSGLKPGDKLVVAGIQRIYYPGMPLKPSELIITAAKH